MGRPPKGEETGQNDAIYVFYLRLLSWPPLVTKKARIKGRVVLVNFQTRKKVDRRGSPLRGYQGQESRPKTTNACR